MPRVRELLIPLNLPRTRLKNAINNGATPLVKQ